MTKRRSACGFDGGAGGREKECSRLRQNVGPQHQEHDSPVCPFEPPCSDFRGMAAASERIERQGPEAFADCKTGGAGLRTVRRSAIASRDDEDCSIHRGGSTGSRRREKPRCGHVLPLAVAFGKFVRGSTKAWVTLDFGRLPRSPSHDHCTPRSQTRAGRPVVEPPAASFDDGLWKEKGQAALDEVRKAKPVPAVSVAISLDGSRFALTGAKKRAGAGRPAQFP